MAEKGQITPESLEVHQAVGKVLLGGVIFVAGAFAYFLLKDTYDWLMKPAEEPK